LASIDLPWWAGFREAVASQSQVQQLHISSLGLKPRRLSMALQTAVDAQSPGVGCLLISMVPSRAARD